jgi:Predicted transcriptional regulators
VSIIFDRQRGAIYRWKVDVSELGALLRKARSDIGLSQGDVARMTGLSRQTINYAEQGRVGLGADSLLDLMGLLGIRFEQSAEDERALALLAKTASVSYRETLPVSQVLSDSQTESITAGLDSGRVKKAAADDNRLAFVSAAVVVPSDEATSN